VEGHERNDLLNGKESDPRLVRTRYEKERRGSSGVNMVSDHHLFNVCLELTHILPVHFRNIISPFSAILPLNSMGSGSRSSWRVLDRPPEEATSDGSQI
jgi:hypothetical protein